MIILVLTLRAIRKGESDMEYKKTLAVILVTLFVLPLLGTLASAQYVQEIIVKRISQEDNAIQALKSGQIQGWMYELSSPDLAKQLEQQGFKVYGAFSLMHDLLINPSHCSDGSLNIFTSRKARYAIQFLLPRGQIAANIYKGFAIPVVAPWPPQHPDYPHLLPTFVKIQSIIDNAPADYGKKLLTEALQELGAKKGNDGKWYYNGKPVVVKMNIRVQDERKEIGDIIASKLEEVGITVERNYVKSPHGVYDGDPTACEWQIYTEGWLTTSLTKYDFWQFVAFYSRYLGWIAPWGDYKNETIENITNKLVSGNYASIDEFWKLLNDGVWLGFHESTRVFGFIKEALYVASPDLKGIIYGPATGPWNTFTFLGLQYTKGDTVTFANMFVYWEGGTTWNPVDGFGDAYSDEGFLSEITFNPGPRSRLTDGETGWTPANLVSYKILGIGNITMPDDAVVYDIYKHHLVHASDAANITKGNLTAVLINYKILGQLKFHDGSPVTVADMIPWFAVIYEYATNTTTSNSTDPWYEQNFADDLSYFLDIYKGVKVVNSTAIIVYMDYSSLDPGDIADTANIWSNWPLELLAGMDLLVRTGNYVWDLGDADPEQGIVAVHLVDPTQVNKIVELLNETKDNPPIWVQDLINLGLLTKDQWAQRVNNLIAFAQEHKHLLIAEGAYYLDSYDPVNDQVVLKRNPQFPIDPQSIVSELAPKTVSLHANILPVVTNKKGSIVATATVQVNGQPAKTSDIKVYALLVNLKTYEAVFLNWTQQAPGQLKITLPKDLPAGDYQLALLVYPVGFSYPASESQVIHLVKPAPSPTTSPTTTTPPTSTTQSPTTTAKAKGGVSAAAWAAVIIIIIILAAAYYYLRK